MGDKKNRRTHGPTLMAALLFCCVVIFQPVSMATSAQGSDKNSGAASTTYQVGVGIADITGPASEVNMMGYANAAQLTRGIHMRLFSRAFVFLEKTTGGRLVFVCIDAGMGTTLVKMEVIKRLRERYGDVYTEENVAISATHTHSGPGGYLQYMMYSITSRGFVRQTFDVMVNGITRSITAAHHRLRDAKVFVKSGVLFGAGVNRSPQAYLNNPLPEREKYPHNTDKLMTVLKIIDFSTSGGKPMGMISWFPVHAVSMNNTNGYISGDHKGYASQLFEKKYNPGKMPGKGGFVAAFAVTNAGDVSPNTRGPHCIDTGLECHPHHSTCNGKSQNCIAFGPGKDMFESTKIIGEKQYFKALQLFEAKTGQQELQGPLAYRHQFLDITKASIKNEYGKELRGCHPAMGYSFAAGTTDGPGKFTFKQGQTSSNPFWNLLAGFISKPTAEQVECQKPKPILLNTGGIDKPWRWQPHIVPVQILRLGNFFIIPVPGEITTMAGRRTRNVVEKVFRDQGTQQGQRVISVISALSNTYTGYITTREEYAIQRYEGAATAYGPNTHEIYNHYYAALAKAILENRTVDAGPWPPNLLDKQKGFLSPVIFDKAPGKVGDIIEDARPYQIRGSRAVVSFYSGNLRNNLMTERTFLRVEKKHNGVWETRYTDANWETILDWERLSTIKGYSKATISWDVPSNESEGLYRICHNGYWKSFWGNLTPYHSCSKEFRVTDIKA